MDDFLLQVKRPARYIGEEWNSCVKDFNLAGIKFALCFPDLYEVGMSNLGIRILYGILNNLEDVVCERFFAPDIDLEKILRETGKMIFSLENKRPLRDFDLVGFSLGHELCFTNVLNILNLGGIPLKSSLRGKDYPLVIGGGPSVMNPEPMHDFFDLFIIGEAEEAILDVVNLIRKFQDEFKTGKLSKSEFLLKFCSVEGVYVPSLYEVEYDSAGIIQVFKPKSSGVPLKIKKRFVRDLNKSFFPSQWIVPYIQIVHDRITLEIMRGCPNSCRFCQARAQYFPYRIREPGNLLGLAQEAYRCTGYEEIALGGLSASDYPYLQEVAGSLLEMFKGKGVSVSLPSIKPKESLGGLTSLLATVKKTGLTLAPEAATEKLRQILGKDFNMEDFMQSMQQSFLNGYQHLKLYFMIGLPFEEDVDLEAIVEFAGKVSELRRKAAGSPAQVNLSVNALIPKPHTPFQWFPMQGMDAIRQKQEYLKKRAGRNRRLKVNFHNYRMSFLEGVLARGDRNLAPVIESAYLKGSRFDAWDDHFIFEHWVSAFGEQNINPDFYLQEKSPAAILPWDFIDVGISREKLAAEFQKIVEIK